MRTLLEALDRFVAQARAARRERVLETPRREAALRIGEAFREQGRLLLDGLREYRWRFALREAGPATGVPAKKRRPAQEWFPEWDALFARTAAQTARAFTIPLERLVRFALKVGAQEVDAGVGVSFSLSNPRAQSYLEAHGAELVRNIDETTRQVIHDILVEGEQQGWSYDRVAQEIIARFEEFAVGRPQEHIDSRAHLIAVTECFPGDTLVTTFSRPIAELPFAGASSFSIGDGFGSGPESSVKWASRRWYEGGLVKITTASGNKLTGTPNHPVLTDRGWVGLGALVEGDNLICYGMSERMGVGNPDINDVPSEIRQVFDSLERVGSVERIPLRGVDFHGDGQNGDVEIVRAGGCLLVDGQTPLLEPFSQKRFTVANLCFSLIARLGSVCHSLIASFGPFRQMSDFAHALSHYGVGGFENRRRVAVSNGYSRPHHPSGFGHAADVNTGILEDRQDVILRNAITASNGLAGFSGEVSADRVVKVDYVLGWSGHVYNLHTHFGYYTANGVIVQNCGNAYEAGNYLPIQAMAEAGLEMEKSWLTVGDDRVSEVCQGNQDEGWIPWDQAHASGQQHPLAHPACRCTELYRRKGSEG